MRKSPLIHTNYSILNCWVIRLNPGYLSFLLISMFLILLSSGWKDILAKGLSRFIIFFFFAGWIMLSFFHISVEGVTVSLELPFLIAVAFAGLRSLRQPILLAHVISAGLLIGMFDFLLLELDGYMPWFSFGGSLTETVVFPAAISLMTGLRVIQQFVCLSLGLSAGEILHQVLRYSKGMPIHLGGAGFQDHWWMTFGLTRICSVVFEYGCKYSVRMAKLWFNRRKEWRK